MASHLSRGARQRGLCLPVLWLFMGLLFGALIGYRQKGYDHGLTSSGAAHTGNGNATLVADTVAATGQLKSSFSHVTILDPVQLEKGTVGRGSMAQLRRFVAKLLSGEPVTVGAPLQTDHYSVIRNVYSRGPGSASASWVIDGLLHYVLHPAFVVNDLQQQGVLPLKRGSAPGGVGVRSGIFPVNI